MAVGPGVVTTTEFVEKLAAVEATGDSPVFTVMVTEVLGGAAAYIRGKLDVVISSYLVSSCESCVIFIPKQDSGFKSSSNFSRCTLRASRYFVNGWDYL